MKRFAQKALLTGIRSTRLHRLLAPATAGRGIVLTMHRVRSTPPAAFAPNQHLEITPDFLGAAIDCIRAEGLDIVTLDKALERLRQPKARRFACLTFDDGYRDNLEIALPVLKAKSAPFTVYVATGFADRAAVPWWLTLERIIAAATEVTVSAPAPTTFPAATAREKYRVFNRLAPRLESLPHDELPEELATLAALNGFDIAGLLDRTFMDWDELARLSAEPLATIGAHTVTHPAMSRLTANEARREMVDSVVTLANRLGRRPIHFAYPFGYQGTVSDREPALAVEAGFATAVRTSPGTLDSDDLRRPTDWPRVSLNGFFQSPRYLEVMLAGTPFGAANAISRLRGGRRSAQARSLASNGSR